LISLNRHREFGIVVTSLFHDMDIGQEGLWNVQNTSKMVH